MDSYGCECDKTYKHWYAVYTVVRHEKTVNRALADKEIETFLPIRKIVSQWKDRKKLVHLPLFPGYLFVNISLKDTWSILNTNGVVRILGVKGVPLPMPFEQIEAIRKLLESKLKYDPYPYLSEGKEVIVLAGPLQGVKGKVVEKRGINRVILSVDLIKRSVSVEVEAKDLELA